MIDMGRALLDTNVLVYAADADSHLHAAAARLVDRGLRQRGEFCVAPQNIVEFAAVVTRARFVARPMPSSELKRMGDVLYRSRRLGKIYPRRGTVIRAIREGAAMGITGAIWYDLFLAMTMRDAGVEIIVTENMQDFRRFGFVRAIHIEEASA
ncbi:MAG: PIN domain-containing protein [Tepidisphaeraceae bacterium]|jgi:predicted nucleic acid-binding protein